uniref:SLED domain-containing protein n=1 Tax=Angiostrongylus cantonensis TaxID=6313 RepID=A0A158P5Z2_ANGCA
MTGIVPEAEEFGHDVPMDPTMESEDSEHSEELVMSEPLDSECHIDDVGDNEDVTERFSDFAVPTTTRNKHEEATSRSPSIQLLFDWNSYLREQKAEPAPKECFFQPDTPPENKFQIGMKLMIADPRGMTHLFIRPTGTSAMFCLGTVVNVYKLWLCVRLEGLDNSHEKWIFCDDESIQPIGPTTEDHMKLNPPIGFIHHHGTFPKFLEQHLKPDDETGKSRLCPPEWFRPISETLKPVQNFFSVGQKVEAIDQRSFNGKTCPATIAGVTKSHIQIHFDGWNSGYDIKEPYYTRFVMPVGWSQRNGVDISPPKSEAKNTSRPTPLTVSKQSVAQRQKHRSTVTKSAPHASISNSGSRSSSSSSSSKVVRRLSDMGVNPVEGPKGRGARSSAKRPAKNGTATPPLKKSVEDVSPTRSKTAAETSLFVKVNPQRRTADTDSIRVTVQKARCLENSVEDKVKDLLMHAKVEQQRLAKQLSQPPSAYISSPKSVRSPPPLPLSRLETSSANVSFYAPIKICPKMEHEKAEEALSASSTSTPPLMLQTSSLNGPINQRSHDIVLLSKDEIPVKERLMTIFVNYTCDLGPNLDPIMVAGIRRKFGPFAIHHALREAVQQLLNCSTDDSAMLNLVQPAAITQILSVTG